MKYVILFLAIVWATGSFPLHAQHEQQDLIIRLNHYSAEKYKSAVYDLQKKYPGQFTPDKDWEKTVAELQQKKEELTDRLKAGDTQAGKEAVRLLRKLDAVLLANPLLAGKPVVSIHRTLTDRARKAMSGELGIAPSNFQNNSEIWNTTTAWKNEFVTLHISPKGVEKQTLFKPQEGVIITDPEPAFDGERILYSSIGTNNRWHLFELDLKTNTTKQVTPEAYRDFDSFDGCYTPGGKYIFCSTGTFLGLPCTNGGNKMCGLFLYDPQTDKTRQLTYDQDSNWGPVVLSNGLILYQRWEYADIPHSNSRLLFTMNPDGTGQLAYYGSNSYFPTAFFGARPVPGHPTAVAGVATGHHSVSRSGRLFVIDPAKGRKEADGVVAEIPHSGRKAEAEIRDLYPNGVWPQFLHPFPLSDTYFLVSMKASPNSLWGLYLVDTFDNITLIAEEENSAYLEPILVEKQPTPPVIPDRVMEGETTATVYLQDIYKGEGLKGIPQGTVKKLRIGSYSFSPINQGGLLGTIGMDGPWDVKRILGEVDVEADGSAMFTVPANTPVFVQPLDEEGKALQWMRSWFTAMPGEMLSCIGCHEDRNTIPSAQMNMASRKKPQAIREWYGKARGFSYRHEVQPVLDRYCISCHQDEGNARKPYLKGDKWITDWSSQIAGAADPSYGGHFTVSYANLHRYVRRPGIESDMHMLVPMDVHADQTELMQVLTKGHHQVSLDREAIEKLACWIDMNAPFHGRRSDISNYPDTKNSRDLKKQYSAMFCAPVDDLEWLPEIKTDIVSVLPEKKTLEKGESALDNWPLYDPVNTSYHDWSAAQNAQLGLDNFQKKIDLGDGVALELVKIPSGVFLMGSDLQPDEMPRSKVAIDRPFWMGRFEITNEQYRLFNAEHDSRDEHRHGYQFGRRGYSMNHDDQPVVRVSWEEAMAFCDWLSQKTGLKVTLPTEAQWEWACRSGSSTPYWFGASGADFSPYANLGDIKLKEFAACTSYKFYESARILDHPNRYDDWIPRDTTYNDGGFISEAVGRYIRNPWDLYDMHGNVWEWTLSSYQPYPYDDTDGRNTVVSGNNKRVARGGSWYDRPHRATSSFRLPYRAYQKVYNVGFRIVIME
ncbi:MAG: SUMF1/EgtB/PvdO family nonheme iron enzyme [Tannerellaceae bacterium]|jgi:formylglycine-generating enzyme required for sulfatase activity|nr:SUMF1/EgtB/PvdO family nonheme iron enzyme [Tannerellaceae bacterium]